MHGSMRYLVVCSGDRMAEQLAASLIAAGVRVLCLSCPTPARLRAIVAQAPDTFVVRMPTGHVASPFTRFVLDLAAFGHRPVIGLLTAEEFQRVGRPEGVQAVVLAPYRAEDVVDAAWNLADEQPPANDPPVLRCGDVTLDRRARTVHVRGQRVDLTYAEFELLSYLCRHKGLVVSRRELLRFLVSARGSGRALLTRERAIDVHVARLRHKLANARGIRIVTVPHVGYRCDEHVDISARPA
ncbi:MAG: hypothetical protein C4290_01495 [Chloroflexota bacterium]